MSRPAGRLPASSNLACEVAAENKVLERGGLLRVRSIGMSAPHSGPSQLPDVAAHRVGKPEPIRRCHGAICIELAEASVGGRVG